METVHFFTFLVPVAAADASPCAPCPVPPAPCAAVAAAAAAATAAGDDATAAGTAEETEDAERPLPVLPLVPRRMDAGAPCKPRAWARARAGQLAGVGKATPSCGIVYSIGVWHTQWCQCEL